MNQELVQIQQENTEEEQSGDDQQQDDAEEVVDANDDDQDEETAEKSSEHELDFQPAEGETNKTSAGQTTVDMNDFDFGGSQNKTNAATQLKSEKKAEENSEK